MSANAGSLSDHEVAQEMNKMVAFIKQEALEKARETKIKADEEFNIEKGKIVRAETVNIEAFFQKKLKQADIQRKIAQSHVINKNRLKVLAACHEVLNDLFAEAKANLKSISSDQSKYADLLKNLLLQGLFRLMEPMVLVQAREVDYELVETAIKKATVMYTSQTGHPAPKVQIDKQNPLPSSSMGGVVVGNSDWRIKCQNTLESRLELLRDQIPHAPIAATVEEIDVAMIKLRKAQDLYSTFSQSKVDEIFKHVALVANQHRLDLAKFAVGETEKGVIEDKVIKNHFASEYIYNRYKHDKSCDVIERDTVNGIIKVAEPIGPIAGIIPVTNPTSTIIFKTLLALKTRNGIMFSPHPGAQAVSAYAVQLLLNAAVEAGAPQNILACTAGQKHLTQHVLQHPDIHFILATGGPSVVNLSYHSGKPAIGVGAGNCPALIDETADLHEAISGIILSKTFDSGMICAAENSCVIVDSVYNQAKDVFSERGAYICNSEEKEKLAKTLVLQDGKEKFHLNGAVVGKTASEIASLAGFSVPPNTVCLIGEASDIGPNEAMSYEKLCPVLGLYKVSDFHEGVEVAKRLATFGGVGHTSVLYTHPENRDRIEEYEKSMPTFRVLIDMPSSQGAIGDLYNFKLDPSLTLGCGTKGGSAIAENLAVHHLLNIKTIASKRENMLWFKVPQQIYFKRGILHEALKSLPEETKRIMIVTDKTMTNLGHVDKLIEILKEFHFIAGVYDRVLPDPTFACVMDGVAAFNDFKPDVIIAFGGGSPIDAAKIMRLIYEHPEVKIQDLTTRFMDIRKRVMTFPKKGTKVSTVVCLPTTSGTGAEITPFAVLTGDDGHKYPICSYHITPEMAIVDPLFAVKMPKSLTANTGYDALVHSVESYVSIVSSDYTRALSVQALKMIYENLPFAYNHPSDEHYREKVHNGAAIAGMAFANAFLGICHSMAHQLGALFHIPHGLANALVFSHVIRFNASNSPTKMAAFPQYKYPQALAQYAELSDALGLGGTTPVDKVNKFIDALETLKSDIGMVDSIKSYGISWEEYETKLDQLAEMAFDDQCTGANPRYPLMQELRQLFIDAYHGRPLPLEEPAKTHFADQKIGNVSSDPLQAKL